MAKKDDEIDKLVQEFQDKVDKKDKLYKSVSVSDRTDFLIKLTAVIVAVVVIGYFILMLFYWYDDFGDYNVVITEHDCIFTDDGIYFEGDCQNYGYTEYYCELDYCDTKVVIYDTEYGPHKYSSTYEIVEEDGCIYYEYTCYVCGSKNRVLISDGSTTSTE